MCYIVGMFELSSEIIPKWRLAALSIFGGASIGFAIFASPMLFVLPPDRLGCDAPIHWSLGSVDSRFPLSPNKFRSTAFEAEQIWEETLGRDIFVFNNSASFQLKTVFDDRQKMTYENQKLDKTIEEYESMSESAKKQYDSLQAQYKKLKSEYDALAQEFRKDLAAYEKEVTKWNKSGGAPDDIYEDLAKEKEDLEKKADMLNDMSAEINELVKKINSLAEKVNSQNSNINEQIETFREKYGEPKAFIQGLYDPNANDITIFQFQDQNDLRLVIAHEFGHALGIQEHVSDPTALMHFLMDQQDILNPKLSQEDIDAYATACPARNFSILEKLKRYLVLTTWEKINFQDILGIFK